MAQIVEDKDSGAKEFLGSLIRGCYLDGQCYELAIALHRGLGWPIVAVMKGAQIWHAVVRSPDGSFWDARGKVELAELGRPFALDNPELKDVEESDLLAVRTVDEHAIKWANRRAQSLWPELQWADSFQLRALCFAEALEKVCRHHGIWIRSPIEGIRSLLAAHEPDDDPHYELCLTDDGLTYTIERRL